jgi:hypothetical protein
MLSGLSFRPTFVNFKSTEDAAKAMKSVADEYGRVEHNGRLLNLAFHEDADESLVELALKSVGSPVVTKIDSSTSAQAHTSWRIPVRSPEV